MTVSSSLHTHNPALTMLCASPRLYIADNFATDAEIEHILAVAADAEGLERRGIATRHNKAGFSFEMPIQGDPALESLSHRLNELIGMVNEYTYSMRFRRYLPGEYHPPHLDCYEIKGLHLVLTALLYLTDTEEGGETAFPRAQPAPVSITPRRGRLGLWFNYTPDGQPDETSWHEALAVVQGEKATLGNFVYKPLAFAAQEL